MENPTFSRHPNMLSKKTYNGFSTAPSKAVYDDVFGGGPKFGAPALSPRVEDYAEIFGGFRTPRAASIPVLDLPLVDDEVAGVCFDVRGSGFDYAEVFGGFDGREFAVSYEELVRMMEPADGRDDSSNAAWTPSDESDHSAKHQRFSNGDSSESIDGYTEFSISYNKAGQNCNENPSNGIRHTTQFHDPSRYTFEVDKPSSLPNSDSPYPRDNGAHQIIDCSGEILGQRHLRKTMSQPANSSNGPFFGDDVKPHGELVRNGSMFLTISDVSLRTRPSDLPPPSRPPPAMDVEKGCSDKTTPSCRSVASEESAGGNSPPYFDVEVDASSSAAASAAAMKDAMKKAQVKLKSAKESMERKQEVFHSRRNSDSKILRRNKEEKATKLVNGFGSVRGEGGEDNVIEFSVMDEKYELKKTSQIISDSLEGNYSLNMVKKSTEENKGRESLSSQGSDFIDVTAEWKEASQFYELVTNKSKKVFVQENDKIVFEQDSKCFEGQKKEKRANVEGLQGYRGNGVKVGANCELEFIERSEMANKQKTLDKRVQMTGEDWREEQIEKKFSIDLQTGETRKRRMKAHDLQKHSNSERALKQSVGDKEKGTNFEENDRSMGNVKKFPQGKEESDKRSRSTLGFQENEKKFDGTSAPAETEIKMVKVSPREEKERTKKAVLEQEENEKEEKERRLREKSENEENEKRKKEVCEREENEKKRSEMVEREANEKRLKEAKGKEENKRRLKENLEKEERKRIQIEAIEQEEKANRQREENEKRRKQALEKEEMQRRQREAILKEENENIERLENERRLKQALEKEEMERKQREVAEQENAKREREEIAETIKEALESEPAERKEKVCLKPEKEGPGKSSKLMCDLRNVAVAAASGPEQKSNEKIKRCQVNLDAGNQGVKSPRDRNDVMSDGAVKERDERRNRAQPAMEVKGSNHQAGQQLHRSQSTKQKGKIDSLQQVDEESERMKRERDMEQERLRKMEEEREREREREKDRMAVDRTILESRERVYAERANLERATAEVRQRALNEARERLEKACAEAKEKSFPDNKASVESRIRAERAAVERATAEARERAFEKAMAERNAFERSVSDKFSVSSRNGGFRPNSSSYELHNQQSWSAKGSKHQYSSVYTERFGDEGESPQRCKARLERHRRTAERAANALEELNMRDLHAQREQAERNRLAETLDAEVKRWSSGKEGNLRALLSTLQYILGPDSGWQPIHLTEVITAAAVKKAYRKATLCVHPDKLQQRGASIQHKYICEKVFDLLKEAWNRFNSEER